MLLGLIVLSALAMVVVGAVTAYMLLSSDGEMDTAATVEVVEPPMALPPGVQEGEPYISFGEGGPVVDVYVDYLCSYCADLAAVNSEDLRELAGADEATVRFHLRPTLNSRSDSGEYSERAANAAVAVWAEDPELFWDMELMLYGAIAEHGTAGLSDEELLAAAQEVGATDPSTAEAITEGTYREWIRDVVEEQARETVEGIPTVLIDGEQFTGDWAADGELRAAIEGA
ncbi:MAG: thioredoxin domain-containing protein [Brachybacterium sp.]|nr:thioredoxin domain-containing protein [Brachybacterium sp.]